MKTVFLWSFIRTDLTRLIKAVLMRGRRLCTFSLLRVAERQRFGFSACASCITLSGFLVLLPFSKTT